MFRSALAAALIVALAACSSPSTDTAPPQAATSAPTEEAPAMNALLVPSSLPMQAPPFDKIKDWQPQAARLRALTNPVTAGEVRPPGGISPPARSAGTP